MSPRTLFATITLAVVVFFGALSSSFGQPPNICVPDCFGNPFTTTQITVLTLPNGCVVRVKYSTRFACNQWYDVGIESVEELTPGCSTFTIKQLLDLATVELMTQNPMGFPTPGPDSCINRWRVVNGGCWRDSISCDGDTLIVPCDLEVCCLSRFKICADSLGNIDSVIKTSATANHDCDTTDPDCVPVCGDDPGNGIGGPGLSGIRISTPPDKATRRGKLEIPVIPAHGRISEKAVVPERKALTRNR